MPSSRPSNNFQRISQDDLDIRHDNDQVLGADHDSNDEGSGSSLEPAANSHAPRLWGVHWASPTSMMILFLAATGSAIGYHFYYSGLHGTVVMDTTSGWKLNDVRNSQEWALRLGTGFAFLVQSMFAAAVNIALQQRVSVATRKKPITIGGLDAMFSAAHSLLSFTSMEFLCKAKLGAGLALLVW